jgi:hypothetical protein
MTKQDKSYKKSRIKENILQYIELHGISKYDFYKRTGITRGVLDQNTGISEENIAKILAYFSDINIEWLILGKGSMVKDDTLRDNPKSSSKPNLNTNMLSEPFVKMKKKDNPVENQLLESCPNCSALNNILKATEKALEHAESEIESRKDITTLLSDKIRELNEKIEKLEHTLDG